jgi:hypothetical protein
VCKQLVAKEINLPFRSVSAAVSIGYALQSHLPNLFGEQCAGLVHRYKYQMSPDCNFDRLIPDVSRCLPTSNDPLIRDFFLFAIVFLWNCRAVYQNRSAAKTSSAGNIEKWSKLTRQRRS